MTQKCFHKHKYTIVASKPNILGNDNLYLSVIWGKVRILHICILIGAALLQAPLYGALVVCYSSYPYHEKDFTGCHLFEFFAGTWRTMTITRNVFLNGSERKNLHWNVAGTTQGAFVSQGGSPEERNEVLYLVEATVGGPLFLATILVEQARVVEQQMYDNIAQGIAVLAHLHLCCWLRCSLGQLVQPLSCCRF